MKIEEKIVFFVYSSRTTIISMHLTSMRISSYVDHKLYRDKISFPSSNNEIEDEDETRRESSMNLIHREYEIVLSPG